MRFSGRWPVPFVGRLSTELEHRRALDSGGFRLEMTQMGMESHHRVVDDIAPSQISPSLGRFAVRTARRSSDPSTARRHPTFLTFLKPDVDADVEFELLDDRHNS